MIRGGLCSAFSVSQNQAAEAEQNKRCRLRGSTSSRLQLRQRKPTRLLRNLKNPMSATGSTGGLIMGNIGWQVKDICMGALRFGPPNDRVDAFGCFGDWNSVV
jgi:hypothetical protein